ncbi:MAG: 3-hydroxyacyl-CoA dehydrogenase NAD-binding domain-containing protein [Gemmatimonadaceae bacterium]|nr:3-hydroxyacyl-CoA dehydrogenase NAD-binding domain-containing protein [Gemmatimonadaceae bacterium]
MAIEIRRAAVIGAGTMGSGIAAQLANAGIPVLLLDVVPPGATERNTLAAGALTRMRTQQPAPFMSAEAMALVTPGNVEDDLEAVAEVDWIIEAVFEDPAVKAPLYRTLDAARRPGSIISSNTSTIPLQALIAGQSDAFARDFAITHFFNPPRYMRLLELVSGPQTRPEVTAALHAVADERLGKGVVVAKDTPGFIANRIGTYFMYCAMHEAVTHGLSVEEADAICGKPMGLPKTGIFGLTDLVGLDLMPHIMKSFHATLPAGDAFLALPTTFPPMERLIAAGNTGRKSKGGGFTRLVSDAAGGRTKEVVDLQTGAYRTERAPQLASLAAARGKGALRTLVAFDDRGGRFAASLLAQALSYAAALVPTIADRVSDVDQAMRLGYGWTFGPFELIDQLGATQFAALLTSHGIAVPPLVADGKAFYRVEAGVLEELLPSGTYAAVPRPAGVLSLADVKRAGAPVMRNGSASVWDIGDGVLCLEFTSKMNSLDGEIMAMIRQIIAAIGDGAGAHKALVIYNDGENFTVGANLALALFTLNIAMWDTLSQSVADGQSTYAALQHAPFPVVAAPAGMAFGGGTELLLHSDAVQAAAESYIGLVEAGVGIIPGWGGCKEMLLRHVAPVQADAARAMAATGQVFQTIATAKTSTSAADARAIGFLRPSDGITMNRDRLLADAKAKVLALLPGYVPPAPRTVTLSGARGKSMLMAGVASMAAAGKVTAHDQVVAAALASVLTGGETDGTAPLDEAALLTLERTHFMHLARTTGTLLRIEHMLNTGKPLRN